MKKTFLYLSLVIGVMAIVTLAGVALERLTGFTFADDAVSDFAYGAAGFYIPSPTLMPSPPATTPEITPPTETETTTTAALPPETEPETTTPPPTTTTPVSRCTPTIRTTTPRTPRELTDCEKTNELIEFMEQFGDLVSVHFENLESGFIFQHYGNRRFFGASATKAPFALYIYQKARDGCTNLNSRHYFTEIDYWGGSGRIRHNYEFGASFTQHELLHLMLAPSDNVATRILRRAHGLIGYREFIASLGGNTSYIQNITYSYLSANEAGFYMREIFHFINSGGAYSREFRQNLQANRYPFITSTHPVASKSGWAANFGGAWHDMAIVFAPSPYVVALLSTLDGSASDRAMYNQISRFLEDFNTRWFE